MAILANVLWLLPAALTAPIAFASRIGPEGPVGAHMVTAPLALLQAVALGLAIHAGAFDAVALPRAFPYALLPGFVVTLTVLPIVAIGRQRSAALARAALVATWLAGVVAINAPASPSMAGVAAGVPLGLVGLSGWLLVLGLVLAQQRAALRRAGEAVERQSEFEKERAAWDRGEFAKVPANPELWQLIPFPHSPAKDVQAACLQRIAALPELERETIELLGTGWAEHALHWLRDFYALPPAPLAPAYARFLDEKFEGWRSRLANDPSAGGWEVNLQVYFDVAEKIAAAGGDLRAPLARWREFLAATRGLGGLARRIDGILQTRARA